MNRITPFGTENFVIVPIIFLSKFLVPKFIPWCLCRNRVSLSESGFTRLADEQDNPIHPMVPLREQGQFV